MHTLNVQIPEEHYETLRKYAFEAKVSIAHIVRQAIKNELDAANLDDMRVKEE